MKKAIIFAVIGLTLAGCTQTEKGASIGAVSGAVIGGAVTGNVRGAAVGALAGIGVGAVMGGMEDRRRGGHYWIMAAAGVVLAMASFNRLRIGIASG